MTRDQLKSDLAHMTLDQLRALAEYTQLVYQDRTVLPGLKPKDMPLLKRRALDRIFK